MTVRRRVFLVGGALLGAVALAAPAVAQCDPEILSHLGGSARCLDRNADRLQCVFGDELYVFDISTLESPKLQGRVILPGGDARAMAAADGFAYIVQGSNGLTVVDVHDPFHPVVTRSIPVKQIVDRIVIAGARAYVCGTEGAEDRVFILDISTPGAPVVGGIYHVSDQFTTGIAARGSTLFAASGDVLDIVDVADPAAPDLVGTYTPLAGIVDIAVAGDLLFVQTLTGLEIVDVSVRHSPARLSSLGTEAWGPIAVNGAGTRAYVETFADLQVIDTTDPQAPFIATLIDYANGPDVLASGTNVFVADARDGLLLYDCADAGAPVRTWCIEPTPTGFVSWDVNQTWAVFSENHEIGVLDVRTPGAPQAAAGINLPTTSALVALQGNLLCAAYYPDVLEVYALDPDAPASAPVLRGSGTLTRLPDTMALVEGLLVMACRDASLEIWDVSNPAAPAPRGSASPPNVDNVLDLEVQGNVAYVLEYSGGVRIYDISNPDAPVITAVIPLGGDDFSIAVRGSLLCDGDRGSSGNPDQLVFYDISDPAAPAFLGAQPLLSNTTYSIDFFDGTLMSCDRETGVRFLDISDVNAVREVGFFPLGSGAEAAHGVGDRLWVMGYQSGLWEASAPGDPRVITDPVSTEVCAGFITSFHAEVVRAFAYSWRKDGVAIANGPTGNGSVVSGAFSPRLTIAGARDADAGMYDCTAVGLCGFVRTVAAALVVTPCCAADFNDDGALNSADFFAFLGAFFTREPRADVNDDGAITSQDFFDFIAAFFAGC